LLAILALSCLPLQLAPLPLTAYGPNSSEQHEGSEGKLVEEAKLTASQLRLRRISLLPPSGPALVRARPLRIHPVRIESLVHEDPRRGLLPRWTAPPEPDEHA
jgi:hypothetical protein